MKVVILNPILMLPSQVLGAMFFLNKGFSVGSNVDLAGIRVGVDLVMSGSTNLAATIIDNAQIRGDVLLRNGFVSYGRVELMAAKIGGDLDCSSSRFLNDTTGDDALSIDDCKISGNIFLNQPIA